MRTAKTAGKWLPWDETRAASNPGLADSIASFDAGPHGVQPAAFLRDAALAQNPVVRTFIYVEADRVDAFFSLRMSEVTLSQKQRASVGASHSTVGAATLTYVAKRLGANINRSEIELAAVGTALLARRAAGCAVLGFEPGSESVADLWRRQGWKNSQTPVPHNREIKRMWRPLGN